MRCFAHKYVDTGLLVDTNIIISKMCLFQKDVDALNIVDLLISREAHLGVKNNMGETPIDLIFKNIQNPIEYLRTRVFDPLIQVKICRRQLLYIQGRFKIKVKLTYANLCRLTSQIDLGCESSID